jgi:hypothetical protein
MVSADIKNQTNILGNDISELKKLLLDSHRLDRLASYRNEVNIFDVLKITNTEIRHSNMLAWLLDPMENHGLGDAVLKRLIQWFVSENDNANELTNLLLLNNFTFTVQREFHSIDILLLSPEEKVVICVENKILSGEHGNQLNRYEKIINDLYPNYTACFIFLSPYGDDSSNPDVWKSLGYDTVAEIIDNSLEHKSISQEASLIINHYLSIIRRITMSNQEVIDLCNEIYRKHKYALDLIYENKEDVASVTAQTVRSWFEEWAEQGLIIFDKNQGGSKAHIVFYTQTMNNIIISETESESPNIDGWGCRNHYRYELLNRPVPLRAIFEFSSKGLVGSNYEKALHIQQLINQKPFSENWQRCRIFHWKLRKHQIETVEDFESVAEGVKNELYKIITKDIPEFEARIMKSLEV